MWKKLWFIIGGILLLAAAHVYAAQSTTDVTASEELKQTALIEVLGSGSERLGQDREYIIGNGDILEIEVYGEGSMAISTPGGGQAGGDASGLRGADSGVQVKIDGRISLKHIGEVSAVGMNLTQLADYLKLLFATVYEDPIVTVVLKQSNSKRYTVMGKVTNPGIFYLDYPINLVQVIARCGGFTEWANSELTVVRDTDEKDMELFDGNTLKFDYDDFLKGKNLERNISILPGDIVIIH